MRVLSASLVLSSIVLGGWLTGAKAQSATLDTPPALNSGLGSAEGADNVPLGHVPQPTLDSPGMVVGVTFGQLYTDNLKLAPGDKKKQSGWITQIQPFFKAATSRPRFSGLVDYTLNGYLYEQPSGHNQLSQHLNAQGLLTVLPEHLFVNGTAVYGDAIINNQLPAGSGTFFLTNNRANVGMATLSPFWVQQLGNVGTATLRYTLGRIVYNDRGIPGENRSLLNGIPDVTMNAIQFNVASPKDQTWGWDASYTDQRLNPDFGPGLEFAVAKVGTWIVVNPNLRLLADGGKENNFLPDGTIQKLSAPFWDAGFAWSDTRDSFRFMVGHRFFGRTYQFSWTHEAALLTTNVSYTERPTNYNQQLLGLNPGEGGLPPINIHPVLPSLRERQPYLMKRLSASATYTMPKGSLKLTVYDESRSYFVQSDKQERVANAELSWLFNLGPFTTLTPSVRWQRYQFRSGQTNNSRYGQLALVHQVNAKNFGSVRVRHDDTSVSSASPGAHGYTVNVIFVQWTHLF